MFSIVQKNVVDLVNQLIAIILVFCWIHAELYTVIFTIYNTIFHVSKVIFIDACIKNGKCFFRIAVFNKAFQKRSFFIPRISP